jgi:hypothetical protein
MAGHGLHIKGPEGQIRYVYLPAITFGPWTYEGDPGNPGSGTLKAQIVSCDEYRMSQRPLIAVVPVGRATWRWSVSDLQIDGTALTANVVRQ